MLSTGKASAIARVWKIPRYLGMEKKGGTESIFPLKAIEQMHHVFLDVLNDRSQ